MTKIVSHLHPVLCIPQVRNRWHEWGAPSFIEPMSCPYFIFLPSVAAAQALSRREEVTRGVISHGDTWRMLRLPRIHDRREISPHISRLWTTTTALIFKRHLFYTRAIVLIFGLLADDLYPYSSLEMMTWILQRIYTMCYYWCGRSSFQQEPSTTNIFKSNCCHVRLYKKAIEVYRFFLVTIKNR